MPISFARLKTNDTWVTLADSGASSGSNFLMAMLVARQLDSANLGRFAAAYTVYALGYGVWRALVSEPVLLNRSGSSGGGAVIAASAMTAGALGLIAIFAALLTSDEIVRTTLLMFGAGLPPLGAHDGLRYLLIGSGKARLTLTIDLVWLAGMIAVGFLATSWIQVLAGWFGLGAFSFGIGLMSHGRLQGWTKPHIQIAQTRSQGTRFVGEYLINAVAAQSILFIVGAFGGFHEMGIYRLAAIVAGTMHVVQIGLGTVVMMKGMNNPPRVYCRMLDTYAAAGIGLGLFTAVLVSIVPDSLARSLLGSVWDQAVEATVVVTFAAGWLAAFNVYATGLRGLDAGKKSTNWRLTSMVLTLVACTIGAAAGGAFGASAGLGMATATVVFFCRRDVVRIALAQVDTPASDGQPVSVS